MLIVAFLAVWWVYNTYRPQSRLTWAAGPAGGAAGLRARPELHLGAAQPGAAAADHRHVHADSDHHAPPTTEPTTHLTAAVRPAAAAMPAAAAVRPAHHEPDRRHRRSYRSRDPVRCPTSRRRRASWLRRASEIHRYTGEP